MNRTWRIYMAREQHQRERAWITKEVPGYDGDPWQALYARRAWLDGLKKRPGTFADQYIESQSPTERGLG